MADQIRSWESLRVVVRISPAALSQETNAVGVYIPKRRWWIVLRGANDRAALATESEFF